MGTPKCLEGIDPSMNLLSKGIATVDKNYSHPNTICDLAILAVKPEQFEKS